MLASFSALHYVNHSIGNCPVLLLFNTQPSFIRVTPVASGSVHVFYLTILHSVCFQQSLHDKLFVQYMHARVLHWLSVHQ